MPSGTLAQASGRYGTLVAIMAEEAPQQHAMAKKAMCVSWTAYMVYRHASAAQCAANTAHLPSHLQAHLQEVRCD